MKTTLLLTSIVTLTLSSLVSAASSMLPNCLGMSTDSKTNVEYCISSDGGKSESQKTVALMTVSPGTEKTVVSNTRTTTLRTGKSKTVGQTIEMLSGVFEKFLGNPAPGSVLGKLGSFDKGGEVEFVATSADTLRFDFKSPTGLQSTEFSKADVASYLALLKK